MLQTLAEGAHQVQMEAPNSLLAANSTGNFSGSPHHRGDSCGIGV